MYSQQVHTHYTDAQTLKTHAYLYKSTNKNITLLLVHINTSEPAHIHIFTLTG